jgi:hypothetical protein
MLDPINGNNSCLVVYLIENAVYPNPETVYRREIAEFPRPWWTRLFF